MYQEDELDAIYRWLEDKIARESPAAMVIASIPGLIIEKDLCINDCTFLIRPPSSEDDLLRQQAARSSLWRVAGLDGPIMTMEWGGSYYASTIIAWSRDVIRFEHELIDLPLMALNLLFETPRPILCGGISFAMRETGGIFIPTYFRKGWEPLTLHLKPTTDDLSYSHPQEEIKVLESILRAGVTQETFFATALQMAISADSKCYWPLQERTRIIEYSVALESLVLEHEGELAQRFALRCATLLAGSQDKIDVWKTASGIYKKRSNAVHASKKGEMLTEQDAETVRAFLMRCMLRYLDLIHLGYKKASIITLLDQALLSDDHARKLDQRILGLQRYPIEEFNPDLATEES